MKPVIIYVDDQKENLLIFKAACPPDWDIYLFESPVQALRELQSINPWIILSDQKMPILAGFQFLEICKGMIPDAIRIIVTGYSDEDLLISSIRKAHITDFIKKPWEEEELVTRINAAIGHYKTQRESRRFESELISLRKDLKEVNSLLIQSNRENVLIKEKASSLRKNLESWVPPFISESLENGLSLDNIKRNIASIAFDIKGSAHLFGKAYEGTPVRNKIIQIFTEAIHRHGGIRESVTGDSSVGHFGLMHSSLSPADGALSAAFDFRMALSNLTNIMNIEPNSISVGIALHFTTELPIHIHSNHFHSEDGELLVQKSFDTSSFSTDLLHRIEKITHPLQGTNIIMTKQFTEALKATPTASVFIGAKRFNGHRDAVELHLIPSEVATQEEILELSRAAI